jgi:putative endonuclease
MKYFVYLLINTDRKRSTTYVGYTNNIKKRLKLHNSSKGAKFTRGRKWLIIYKKKYNSKSIAMKSEYKLKKDTKFRNKIKKKFLKNFI